MLSALHNLKPGRRNGYYHDATEFRHSVWHAATEVPPITLSINQESREETLRYYGVTARRNHPHDIRIPIGMQLDMFQLWLMPFFYSSRRDEAYLSHIQFYGPVRYDDPLTSWLVHLDDVLPHRLQSIQHLSIRKFSYRVNSSQDLSTVDMNDSSIWKLATILPMFSGLKTLVLVTTRHTDGTPVYPDGDAAWSRPVDAQERARISNGFERWLRRVSYRNRSGPRVPRVSIREYEYLHFY